MTDRAGNLVSRRHVLAGLMATVATPALAEAPARSLRPMARPGSAVRAPGLPDIAALAEQAGIGGKVSVALAEAGSFTRGAALAGVSQPSFSQQIQMLETLLGDRVVERGGRAHLTPLGRDAVAAARRVLAEADAFAALAARLALEQASMRPPSGVSK